MHNSTASPFASFWMAGFESACHINRDRMRLDMIARTQHDHLVSEDYQRLHALQVRTVRDGIRWHLIDQAGRYNFDSLAPMVEAANQHSIQVIWSLCHYGWPDDLDIWSDDFVQRFAGFCHATAQFMLQYSSIKPIYSPINEISYLAWMAGEQAQFYPFAKGRGSVLKRQLVRAAIAGCDAIWSVDPQAEIVHVDPLIRVIPPLRRPDLAQQAQQSSLGQFEAWDMLTGRKEPELGGHPRYLQRMGVNFYFNNQWVYPSNRRIRWEDQPRDPRWMPLHQLLAEVYERYQQPIFISETSHCGPERGRWIKDIAAEAQAARMQGVPLEGICIYPILDRPDWEELNRWHNSGLWDVLADSRGMLQRHADTAYVAALQQAQRLIE